MKLQVVVPMAGAGKRFSDAGYQQPKPFIPVGKLPMVVRAVADLPPATRVVFLVRAEHISEYGADEILRRHVPQCQIVEVDGLTAGQAATTRLAASVLAPDEPVVVAACDNTHVYSKALHQQLLEVDGADCIVWSYRNDPRVLRNPTAYGWIDCDEARRVKTVSCKKPISEDLLGTLVVSGTFSFSTARLLMDGIDEMVAREMTTNGEYYLDNLPNLLLEQGRSVHALVVDKYIGWGTPADYEDYLLWERHFEQTAKGSDQ